MAPYNLTCLLLQSEEVMLTTSVMFAFHYHTLWKMNITEHTNTNILCEEKPKKTLKNRKLINNWKHTSTHRKNSLQVRETLALHSRIARDS